MDKYVLSPTFTKHNQNHWKKTWVLLLVVPKESPMVCDLIWFCVSFIPEPWKHKTRWIKIISHHKHWEILYIFQMYTFNQSNILCCKNVYRNYWLKKKHKITSPLMHNIFKTKIVNKNILSIFFHFRKYLPLRTRSKVIRSQLLIANTLGQQKQVWRRLSRWLWKSSVNRRSQWTGRR
jgi:hypothetical protein